MTSYPPRPVYYVSQDPFPSVCTSSWLSSMPPPIPEMTSRIYTWKKCMYKGTRLGGSSNITFNVITFRILGWYVEPFPLFKKGGTKLGITAHLSFPQLRLPLHLDLRASRVVFLLLCNKFLNDGNKLLMVHLVEVVVEVDVWKIKSKV